MKIDLDQQMYQFPSINLYLDKLSKYKKENLSKYQGGFISGQSTYVNIEKSLTLSMHTIKKIKQNQNLFILESAYNTINRPKIIQNSTIRYVLRRMRQIFSKICTVMYNIRILWLKKMLVFKCSCLRLAYISSTIQYLIRLVSQKIIIKSPLIKLQNFAYADDLLFQINLMKTKQLLDIIEQEVLSGIQISANKSLEQCIQKIIINTLNNQIKDILQ
ncbi:unnamed protein product [Paramecium octaurelia]|uniref:Uncharacterized protein n=1 Tax=Paramecium octaurelia TaxID=43137 RepID=A0A8S1T2S3_PAROT|nr:unnamed protein product [Paramecium octaurelia]